MKTKTPKSKQTIKGYKVFDPDFKCRGFQFAENTEFKHDGLIKICNSGFHFCIKASHCFSYYNFDSSNIVCEVEAIGDYETHEEDSKVCTNLLKVGRRLTWEEVLVVANEGSNNTGHSNSGSRNSGSWNSGSRNSGSRNSGSWNSGSRNSGSWNSGSWNSGSWNSGSRNSGDSNSGSWNSGSWNSGSRNSGDSNSGSGNSGIFCTFTDDDRPIEMFNKKSNWTYRQWLNSKARDLMCNVEVNIWVPKYSMNEEEKKTNPHYETTDGYVKEIPFKEAFVNAWHNWSDSNKKEFTSLPNFNKKIFFEITGVQL